MLDDALLNRIAEDASSFNRKFDQNTLLDLLEAEHTRILRERGLSLSSHPQVKELLKDVLLKLGDELREHHAFTNAALTAWIVKNVVDYLVAENIIGPENISRDYMIVSVLVALVMDSVYKEWEKYRGDQS